MQLRLWGGRGSIPLPGAAAAGPGGDSSGVPLATDEASELIGRREPMSGS